MPMDARKLWAKSKRNDEDERPSMLLPQHLKDVHAAAGRVLEATVDDQLAALGLDPADYGARLRRCVLLAAAAHDLGKANDHFQGMLVRDERRRDRSQGFRHEWATLLILQRLRRWLLPAVGGSETDFAIVEWAVTGHHPAPNHASPPKGPPAEGNSGTELVLLMGHADFRVALDWLKGEFALGDPPEVADETCELSGSRNTFGAFTAWAKEARKRWDRLDPPNKRLVAAVKDTLVAADVAGSALPREQQSNPWQRITESFAARPQPGDLQEVVNLRLNGAPPREFQHSVANSHDRVTFVKAGCGSGKTLAAYMWAARNHPTRRLFFCYPTTGTATEGFKDYLFDDSAGLPRVGAKLFHSRRDVDHEIILHVGADSKNAEADAALRVDALESWATPVVSCTVDTVLGVVQNNKRGLFAWPALAQSAFVFDEVHAYDDRLFGALLRFLRDLPGLPALLMTASLPAAREEALREVLGALKPIAGPKELEEYKRYRSAELTGRDPLPLVKDTLEGGRKVLWVCNTVKRVMEAADRAVVFEPLVYHSRFKYEDRVLRHKDVIDAFKRDGAALAICSQVAEMSLDLSANLLVSDLAPVPAMIQRLGRLNRRATKDDPWPFAVVQPDNHMPYTPADLLKSREWLMKLGTADLSQRDLAMQWEQTGDQPPDLIASAWLDGGPTTTVTELREASPGVTVLMREDVERARESRSALGRLTLPMPQTNLPWRSWPRERGLPIAPAGTINYDKQRGAVWAELGSK